MGMRTTAEALTRLDVLIRSWQPLIAIDSPEERRVLVNLAAQIANINQRTTKAFGAERAKASHIRLYVWRETTGLQVAEYRAGAAQPFSQQPAATDANLAEKLKTLGGALGWLDDAARAAEHMVVVLCDASAYFPPHNQQTKLQRQLRDMVTAERTRVFILLEANAKLPPTLVRDGIHFDFPFPDPADLGAIVATARTQAPLMGVPDQLTDHDAQRLVSALGGLTQSEATMALRNAMGDLRVLDATVPPYVLREKTSIVRGARGVEIRPGTIGPQHIGGNRALKAWMERKWNAYTPEAAQFGIRRPRGIILAGPPGTGKSLAAEAMGGGLMPVVRINPADMKGSLVGDTEGNWRTALKTVEAIAGGNGVVVQVDEFEKFFGGGGGGMTTSGESIQDSVTGMVLPWMQEQEAGALVVATCNDPTVLRSELQNRFDAIFWVELPHARARAEILAIHLGYRNQTLSTDALQVVARALDGYSGRDIERLVNEALESAWMAGRARIDVKRDLLASMERVVPVAVLEAENIRRAREWAVKNRVPLADEELPGEEMPGERLIAAAIGLNV